jgi:glutamate synthase domain-containing protein 3
MTRGTVVVIGPTGRNFAAGMSGGLAFVLDEEGRFPAICNKGMVDLEPLDRDDDIDAVQTLLRKHIEATGSERAQFVVENWDRLQSKFVKVYPRDYKRVLEAVKPPAAELAADSVEPVRVSA